MATEQEYDQFIAPLLLAVKNECDKYGMSMIARIEWEDGSSGITQSEPDKMSMEQKFTQLAAHYRGNVDGFCMALIKQFDCSNSIYLHDFYERRIAREETD